MDKFRIVVNGIDKEIIAHPDMPLLWVLRDRLGLTGTKYSCGIAKCGACMVHVDGVATPACATPIASVDNTSIKTIEGLSANHSHPVQQAWIELQVPQCGFCQSGQIMAAVALLENNPVPSTEDIDQAMSPVLCRCGTYQRIRAALYRAAEIIKLSKNNV
jgi:aerobic-type carbon monoxide dehydrogenase small subunit (CoxS/CutS family)